MRIVLFDLPADRINLFPLTLTRPISHLRVGILTIREKWSHIFPESEITISTSDYLKKKFGKPDLFDTLWVNAMVLPNRELIEVLKTLSEKQSLYSNGTLIAFKGDSLEAHEEKSRLELETKCSLISRCWDIFKQNGDEIRKDFDLLTSGRVSHEIGDSHTITYGGNIFLEEGVSIKAAVLNAENGPIYIGKNAEIGEGTIIRGPFALGEHSVVNMGAKIRGDTTVGPWCKVGGEVSKSIIMGYSNKAHDGFLGNSVIGEWCNFGADTNVSNLKNNYAEVKMWDFVSESLVSTGEQFCGLVMGDHSKCGINTMFNTGTTVGVSANIFGGGFPSTYIPSFSWGGAAGFSTYKKDKALETIETAMTRRNLSLTGEDKGILNHIFENFSS
ncbi:MAG: GlmU family protein [Cyclobacteriaceae bacterium]